MTYVTCPTMRYHPAVVAQKAATVQLLSDGRFTLGVGAGEHLNEHVTGDVWPPVDVRHEMLAEALEIIRGLFDGETVTFRGEHLQTENATPVGPPPEPPPIGVAASGPASCEMAGRYGDAMIAVQPEAELGKRFDARGRRREAADRSSRALLRPGRSARPEAGGRAVPLVHRRVGRDGRAACSRPLRFGIQVGERGRRRHAGAVR